MCNTFHCLVTMARRSHLFPCRTQKLSSLAPMVVGLTFRKSRTLPGKSNPKGFFFYAKKEVNFFPKKLFEVKVKEYNCISITNILKYEVIL